MPGIDGLTQEESAIVELVRDFVDRDVKPVVTELEHANTYPAQLIDQMKFVIEGDCEAVNELLRPPDAQAHRKWPAPFPSNRVPIGGLRHRGAHLQGA